MPAIPAAPASRHEGMRSGVMPPRASTGRPARAQASASFFRPGSAVVPGLDRVGKTGPKTAKSAPSSAARSASCGVCVDTPSRNPGGGNRAQAPRRRGVGGQVDAAGACGQSHVQTGVDQNCGRVVFRTRQRRPRELEQSAGRQVFLADLDPIDAGGGRGLDGVENISAATLAVGDVVALHAASIIRRPCRQPQKRVAGRRRGNRTERSGGVHLDNRSLKFDNGK